MPDVTCVAVNQSVVRSSHWPQTTQHMHATSCPSTSRHSLCFLGCGGTRAKSPPAIRKACPKRSIQTERGTRFLVGLAGLLVFDMVEIVTEIAAVGDINRLV